MSKIFLKFTNHLFALSFLILLFSSSCKVTDQYYYAPSENNLLTLSKKNDLQLSGTVSLSEKSIKNIQVGYSPIRHIGIIANYMRYDNTNNVYPFEYSPDTWSNDNEMTSKSIAVGGYIFRKKPFLLRPLLPKKLLPENGFLFDVYAGIGNGAIDRFYQDGRTEVNLRFNKWFVRGGVHYRFGSLGASYTFQYSQLNYTSLFVHANPFMFPYDVFEELEDNNVVDTYASTFRIEYGIKYGKVIFSHTNYWEELAFGENALRAYTSLGVIFNIDEFFRKAEK